MLWLWLEDGISVKPLQNRGYLPLRSRGSFHFPLTHNLTPRARARRAGILSASIPIRRTPRSRIITAMMEADGSQPDRMSVGVFVAAWFISFKSTFLLSWLEIAIASAGFKIWLTDNPSFMGRANSREPNWTSCIRVPSETEAGTGSVVLQSRFSRKRKTGLWYRIYILPGCLMPNQKSFTGNSVCVDWREHKL